MKPVPFLLPLSWLYGSGVALRNLFFDIEIFRSDRVSIPVISVGNISTGGTGKTPLVEHIVRILTAHGKKAAVIGRGYKRGTQGFVPVSDGDTIRTTAREGGDEPVLLAEKLPNAVVLVDEHRARAATIAIAQYGVEVIVLDDGFQHRNLYRDLDIVLIDQRRSLTETPMLPAGNRREPLSALRRAQAVVLTNVDGHAELAKVQTSLKEFTSARFFTCSYVPSVLRRIKTGFSMNLKSVKGKKAVVFCGIAEPDRFRNTLNELGSDVVDFMTFDDHHFFSQKEIRNVVERCKFTNAEYILTTEKDAVRLSPPEIQNLLSDQPVFCLEMKTEIHQKEEWERMILSIAERKNVNQ
jgi:tetraacyldisaccharide 4'-kinase